MGFPPRDIDAMSLWQFSAAYSGWLDANAEADGSLDEAQFAAAEAAFDAAPDQTT